MSTRIPEGRRAESGRARCKRWADRLWKHGTLEPQDAALLAVALSAIAGGEKASVAFSINGRRPIRKSDVPQSDPASAPANAQDVWVELATFQAIREVRFARAMCGLLARGVGEQQLLPRMAVTFLAYGLWGASYGLSPECAFFLASKRGRPGGVQRNVQRDLLIAALSEVMSQGQQRSGEFYQFIAEAISAIGLTTAKGRNKVLTAAQVKRIHGRTRPK